VTVLCTSENGEEYVPATWNDLQEPITDDNIHEYLMERKSDPILDSLPDDEREKKRHKVMRSWTPTDSQEIEQTKKESFLNALSRLEQLLLDNSSEISLGAQIESLNQCDNAIDVITMATGRNDGQNSVLNLLAYFLGMIAGLELEDLAKDKGMLFSLCYPVDLVSCSLCCTLLSSLLVVRNAQLTLTIVTTSLKYSRMAAALACMISRLLIVT
jgi:hypothetical protein